MMSIRIVLLFVFSFYVDLAFAKDTALTNSDLPITKVALALFFVCGLILVLFFITKFFKLNLLVQGSVKLVSSTVISGSNKIAVIEVNDQHYLLGVTPQSISLIDKLDAKLDIKKAEFSNSFKEEKIR